MGAWISPDMRKQLKTKKLKQLIHIAKNELALDDDTYRDMLRGLELPTSTTEMSLPQMAKVLEHLKRSGFTVRSKPNDRAQADYPQAKMLRGLWLELHELGYVKNPSETALAAWVKRESKVDALQWLTVAQAQAVIEKLKKWRWRDVRRLEELVLALHDKARVPTSNLTDLTQQWLNTSVITKTVAEEMTRRLEEIAK
jgi:phage gp16-like protein